MPCDRVELLGLAAEPANFGQCPGDILNRDVIGLRVRQIEVSFAAKSDRVVDASERVFLNRRFHAIPFRTAKTLASQLHPHAWASS